MKFDPPALEFSKTGSQAANAVEKGEKPPGDSKGKDGGNGSSFLDSSAVDMLEISFHPRAKCSGFFDFPEAVLSTFESLVQVRASWLSNPGSGCCTVHLPRNFHRQLDGINQDEITRHNIIHMVS